MLPKQEVVAMLLAGGRGSRLGVLTKNLAKPAVPFGGKYRIIDFPLSNCVNSGIETVGVLTQYQPLELNEYIGSGQPWDLDSMNAGVHILQPYEQSSGSKNLPHTSFSFWRRPKSISCCRRFYRAVSVLTSAASHRRTSQGALSGSARRKM